MRYFDVDNYLITAKDPKGPWSEPVYLHSTGFGAPPYVPRHWRKKMYVASRLEEARTAYEKPGPINIVEYDPEKKNYCGYAKKSFLEGTDRGCIKTHLI